MIFKRAKNETMTQKEAIEHFLPLIKEHGKDYKKTTKVRARKAKPGEVIETHTSDGKETIYTHRKRHISSKRRM